MTEHFRPADAAPDDLRPMLSRADSDLVVAKILAVDDDPRNLLAVEEILERYAAAYRLELDHFVTAVTSGVRPRTLPTSRIARRER